MPQGEQFWNPYRLIPVRDKVKRTIPWTDERFRGHNGTIVCTLENLTPLFIGAQTIGQFHPPMLRRNKRVIPGSSLKGMLRSLAEIVGGGCLVVGDPKSPAPQDLKACKGADHLCITCGMFGMMERHSNARVHKGKVSIGDAIVRETEIQTKSLEILLYNKGVRHEPFYRSPQTGKLDGKSRKLYFHQPKRTRSTPEIPLTIKKHAWNIDAMLPGHHFDFEVQFTGLNDDELSLLLYIIKLEEDVSVTIEEEKLTLSGPMRHKIGNAKPLGMGSCRIDIRKIIYHPKPKQRFASLKIENTVLIDTALAAEIKNRTQALVDDKSPPMTALRKMMVWDEGDSRDFRYPDNQWFGSTTTGGRALKRI